MPLISWKLCLINLRFYFHWSCKLQMLNASSNSCPLWSIPYCTVSTSYGCFHQFTVILLCSFEQSCNAVNAFAIALHTHYIWWGFCMLNMKDRKYKKKLIQNMPIVKILSIFFFGSSVTKHPTQNNSLTRKLMKKFEVFNLSFLRHSNQSHQMHGK